MKEFLIGFLIGSGATMGATIYLAMLSKRFHNFLLNLKAHDAEKK